jgi:hypothetical protein
MPLSALIEHNLGGVKPTAEQLVELCYISRVRQRPFGSVERRKLRAQCARNPQRHLSGILLCSPDFFVQMLEGEFAEIETLFGRILKDSRHTDIRQLVLRPISRRHFHAWRLGILDTESPLLTSKRIDAIADYCAKSPAVTGIDVLETFMIAPLQDH